MLRGNAQLTASLLATLGERGIGVLVLTGRQGKPSLFFGRPHNDARRVRQTGAACSTTFCPAYAQRLVQRKLERQCHGSMQRASTPPSLLRLEPGAAPAARTAAANRPISAWTACAAPEGAAASGYFAGLRAVVPASLGFHERNRRPPRDPFNALLSLTYTLAHAEMAFTLHAAGLDPCIGYYHQLSHSRESVWPATSWKPSAPGRPPVPEAGGTAGADGRTLQQSDAGCLLARPGAAPTAPTKKTPNRCATPLQQSQILRQRIAPDMPEFECTRPDYDGDIYGALADSSARSRGGHAMNETIICYDITCPRRLAHTPTAEETGAAACNTRCSCSPERPSTAAWHSWNASWTSATTTSAPTPCHNAACAGAWAKPPCPKASWPVLGDLPAPWNSVIV